MKKQLADFRNINGEMLWYSSALAQIDEFELLGRRLGISVRVVGRHISKSIELPVIHLNLNGGEFFIRDNFHDVNLCVLSGEPVRLPFSEIFRKVYQPRDWDWYLNQMSRARNYSWREWSDDQMDDPGLLQTAIDAPWCAIKSREEKDRWLKRFKDPEWFCKDWSSARLCWDGEFGPGTVMYGQVHPFAEGICEVVHPDALKPYSPGVSRFAFAVRDCEAVERVIRRVTGLQERD